MGFDEGGDGVPGWDGVVNVGMVSWSSIPGISTLTTDIMYLLLGFALVVCLPFCLKVTC